MLVDNWLKPHDGVTKYGQTCVLNFDSNGYFFDSGEATTEHSVPEWYLDCLLNQGLPLIFVINNNAYSIIERRQTELFRKRTIGTNSSNGVTIPELEKLSAVFEFKYARISGYDDIENGIVNSLNYNGSVLCEVFGRLDQKYIEIAAARGKNGRFARRPLEDQWPFLDRDEFSQNMLVKTLEISEE